MTPASDGRVVIGRVTGPFGLRGEAKVEASDPADFRAGLSMLARLPSGEERALVVVAVRPHQNRLLVRFVGVSDAEAADALRGAQLSALVADLPPLPADAYRDGDLIGMQVTDARLGELGAVSGVLHYPHADMLVVGERELLVPMLAAYGVKVDVATATILTSLPEGFEEL